MKSSGCHIALSGAVSFIMAWLLGTLTSEWLAGTAAGMAIGFVILSGGAWCWRRLSRWDKGTG